MLYIYIYIFLDEIPPEVWKTRKFDNTLEWRKGCIPHFSKNLGITKKYRDITFTAINIKVYNVLFLNQIWSKVEEVLGNNQNDFWRNWSTTSWIFYYLASHQKSMCNKFRGNTQVHRFLQGIWFQMQKEKKKKKKKEWILQAHGFSEKKPQKSKKLLTL